MANLIDKLGQGRRRDPLQFNATPWEAPAALLRVEAGHIDMFARSSQSPERAAIWECCCGAGDMARVLESTGLPVIATDIADRGYGEAGVDVLAEEERRADLLITNPAYDDFPDKLIRHAAEMGVQYMALLLKSDFYHAVDKAGRDELFREFTPSRIYPLGWRLDWTGGGAPVMNCSWFVWEYPGKEPMRLWPSGAPVAAYMPPLQRPRAATLKGGAA